MTVENITIKVFTEADFDSPETDLLFKWWALKTHINPEHMLPETPAFFRNNLLCATVAYNGPKIIGAAGLVPCTGKKQQKLYSEGRLAVEFRSNFVHPLYGKRGIATEFIKLRQDFSRQNNFLSMTVTKEPNIVKTLTKFGWQPVENFNGKYEEILMEMRNCTCMNSERELFLGPRCGTCPYHKKIILVDDQH